LARNAARQATLRFEGREVRGYEADYVHVLAALLIRGNLAVVATPTLNPRLAARGGWPRAERSGRLRRRWGAFRGNPDALRAWGPAGKTWRPGPARGGTRATHVNLAGNQTQDLAAIARFPRILAAINTMPCGISTSTSARVACCSPKAISRRR